MTIILKENLSEQEINTLPEKIELAPKVFDAKKYLNKITIEGDPLKTQQEMRDE